LPQTGQNRSPLTWQTKCSSPQRCRTNVCKDRYVRGRYPSLSHDPGPRLGWPTWPKTRLKTHRPNQWKFRIRMLNRRSIRFKPPRGSRKLSREVFRFRTLNQSSPILFRPQRHPNTTVYKKQHQLLRSKRTEWPCKLNPGAFRFRTLSRRCSIRFRKHVPHVDAMIKHSSIKDCTQYSQTAILHHHSPGNTGDWSQKSAKEEALRNHHGLSAINHKLSDALHSTGAQIQI